MTDPAIPSKEVERELSVAEATSSPLSDNERNKVKKGVKEGHLHNRPIRHYEKQYRPDSLAPILSESRYENMGRGARRAKESWCKTFMAIEDQFS